MQQLNILQSVVKSEWGRKTIGPLLLKNNFAPPPQHCKDAQIRVSIQVMLVLQIKKKLVILQKMNLNSII